MRLNSLILGLILGVISWVVVLCTAYLTYKVFR